MMFDIVVHFDRDKLLLQKDHILASFREQCRESLCVPL